MRHNRRPARTDKLILALAAGAAMPERAVPAAAEQAGVSERTAHRRRNDADFRRAVFETQARVFEANRGRVADLASKAVDTLERLMESDKPAVALAAAKAVLELGPRLRESTEQEERINRLEDQADENIDENQLPADDDELVLALAAGAAMPERAVPDAAEQAGLGQQTGEQTANDPMANADFQRAVSRARGRLLSTAVGRLADLGCKATGLLERLMENDEPSVARRAAKTVLLLGPRLRESTELKERLSRLEDQAEERANGEQTAAIIDEG